MLLLELFSSKQQKKLAFEGNPPPTQHWLCFCLVQGACWGCSLSSRFHAPSPLLEASTLTATIFRLLEKMSTLPSSSMLPLTSSSPDFKFSRLSRSADFLLSSRTFGRSLLLVNLSPPLLMECVWRIKKKDNFWWVKHWQPSQARCLSFPRMTHLSAISFVFVFESMATMRNCDMALIIYEMITIVLKMIKWWLSWLWSLWWSWWL